MPLPADLKIPPESISPWRGGETEGLQCLEQHLADQVSLDLTWVIPVAVGGLRSVLSFLLLCVVVSGPQETTQPRSSVPALAEDFPSRQPDLKMLLSWMAVFMGVLQWDVEQAEASCQQLFPVPLAGHVSPCTA